mmetsp:Transcript_29160/g.75041  ORF Transcript_29160/g.75041 Transcript_29160/m.75041 type:complete len:134 (-) Transcript_29160:889-1290(-)
MYAYTHTPTSFSPLHTEFFCHCLYMFSLSVLFAVALFSEKAKQFLNMTELHSYFFQTYTPALTLQYNCIPSLLFYTFSNRRHYFTHAYNASSTTHFLNHIPYRRYPFFSLSVLLQFDRLFCQHAAKGKSFTSL